MLYKDTIREKEFLQLAAQRGVCVSIFLPTTPLTQEAQADRIVLKNLSKEAFEQAEAIADKRQVRAMEAMLNELLEDDSFWAHQAHGLGVLLTPESIKTYRIAYHVEQAAEVADRFYLKPLVPALRPKSAYILAAAQKAVKLYELTPAQELHEVDVPNLPKDFSDATGRTQQRDRAPANRLEGSEGHKVLQTQFLREVEKAVRPVLSGSHTYLILATTKELQAIYRSLNHYDLLADEAIDGSTDGIDEESIKQAAIPLVKKLRQDRIERWVSHYKQRQSESRAVNDLSTIAKLATQGQISDLLVDADWVQYGTVDDKGNLTLTETRSAESYDVIDEVLTRVLNAGGEVLAVRQEEDAPSELMPVAAILRWA